MINRYSVKCNKKHLQNLAHRRLKNLEVENNLLSFDTNDLKQLTDIELVEINDNYKNLIKKIFSKYLISVVGVFVFLLLIVTLTKTITKIQFVNDETYNEDVYNFVDNKLYKVWKFAFAPSDLVELNQEIRKEFYDYQWINVEKEGTTLFINITDDKTLITEDDRNELKPLYSKYDSIVEGYYVESGTINVKVGHSVQKGDLLIDNHVKHYNSDLEEVEAKGYVYGTVSEYENININKEESQVIRSGNKESFLLYEMFGKVVNSPVSKYENYEVEYEDVFSIGNLVKVKRMIFYEVITNTIKYTINDAIEYGESMIYNEFKSNKKYDFEKINEIKIISKVENEYDYEISYLITKVVDLCE